MRVDTDMLVRQHMAYMSQPENAAEARNFETIFDHMFYYFSTILEIPASEARAIVADFKHDSDNQLLEECDLDE